MRQRNRLPINSWTLHLSVHPPTPPPPSTTPTATTAIMNPTNVKINIISDFTCMWCILSHHTISYTLTLFRKTYPSSHITFSLTYRPYFLHLHSSLPIPPLTHAIPKTELAKVKLAGMSEDKVRRLKAKIDGLGRAVGIVFKEGEVIGPTRDAHCLVHIVQQRSQEMQNDLYGALLSLYHERGEDISDRELLRITAAEVGLTELDIEEAWCEKVGKELDQEEEHWRGVADGKGVPVVIVEGPKGSERIDGCPDGGELYETFVRVLEGEGSIAP